MVSSEYRCGCASSAAPEAEGKAMIVEILRKARRLDAAIGRKLGPAYHALLGIGLVVEIVRRLSEFGDLPRAGAVREIFAVVLFGVLLLHQMGELGEHMDRRRKARGI